MNFVWAVLLFSLVVANGQHDMSPPFCENPTGSKVAKMPDLPQTYRVSVDLTSSVSPGNSVFVELKELRDGPKKQNGLKMWTKGMKEFQWIFNWKDETKPKTFRIDNSKSCAEVGQKGLSSPAPFDFDEGYLLGAEKIPTSIADIWALANVKGTDIWNNTDGDSIGHVHGMNVTHLTVCQTDKDKMVVRSMTFCFAPPDQMSVDPKIKEELLLIDVRIFNKSKSGNLTSSGLELLYEMSGWRSDVTQLQRDAILTPPDSVLCSRLDVTKEFPVVSEKFAVAIDHFNLDSKMADQIQVHYDGKQKIVSFEYTEETKNDEPFSSGLTLSPGRYRVVHDFNTGLEYVIDEQSDTCHNVSAIPKDAGDVSSAAGKLRLKSAVDILFTRNTVNWTYAEKLYGGEILSDVWTYEFEEGNVTTTTEVFFLPADWKDDSGAQKSAMPLAMRIYRRSADRQNVTVQHYHNFADFSVSQFAADPFCVEACADGGYSLVVQLNTTKSDIQRFGTAAVQNQLRENLAAEAKVRPIRISSIGIETLGRNLTTFLSFRLLNSSHVEGLTVEGVEKELDVNAANTNLEAVLSKGDLIVPVANGKEKLVVGLKKETLRSAQFYFDSNGSSIVPPTPIIHYDSPLGYTGGSMAGLGICMLIIGSGMGVAAAWWMWKRNRGIAYQVYE